MVNKAESEKPEMKEEISYQFLYVGFFFVSDLISHNEVALYNLSESSSKTSV